MATVVALAAIVKANVKAVSKNLLAAVLKKKADFPKSSWYLSTEEALVTNATIVQSLASPIADELDNFGATAADVADLLAGIGEFITDISNPSLAIDQRMIDNEEVMLAIDDIRNFFNDELDVLMRSLEVDNPSLHNLYLAARAIDENGSARAATVEMDVQPASTVTLHTAPAYNADTFYTFQNQGSEAVAISLSATGNQAGPQAVLLLPGETRSRLADNLAPAGTHLVAQNDSAGVVKVRVWVE